MSSRNALINKWLSFSPALVTFRLTYFLEERQGQDIPSHQGVSLLARKVSTEYPF